MSKAETYGKWTVIEKDTGKKQGTRKLWLCQCTCGVEKFVNSGNLRSGRSKGCSISCSRGKKPKSDPKAIGRPRLAYRGAPYAAPKPPPADRYRLHPEPEDFAEPETRPLSETPIAVYVHSIPQIFNTTGNPTHGKDTLGKVARYYRLFHPFCGVEVIEDRTQDSKHPMALFADGSLRLLSDTLSE